MPTRTEENPLQARWDVHQHRDELHVSDGDTVYHLEKGQLCWFERQHGDFQGYLLIAHPIKFNDKPSAYRWIREGCIAEIQESLCNLHVGFTTHCTQRIEREETTNRR